MLTTTEVFDKAALTSLTAAATLLGADLKAGLFTNTPTISKVLAIADLVEPDYASYVRQLVVMGAPFRDPAAGIAALATGLLWQQTGSPTPVTITGIFYTYGTGPTLLGAEIFPRPIPLNDLIDAFTTILEYIQSSDNPGLTTVVQ